MLRTLKASLPPLCWEEDVLCWIKSWGLWSGGVGRKRGGSRGGGVEGVELRRP